MLFSRFRISTRNSVFHFRLKIYLSSAFASNKVRNYSIKAKEKFVKFLLPQEISTIILGTKISTHKILRQFYWKTLHMLREISDGNKIYIFGMRRPFSCRKVFVWTNHRRFSQKLSLLHVSLIAFEKISTPKFWGRTKIREFLPYCLHWQCRLWVHTPNIFPVCNLQK